MMTLDQFGAILNVLGLAAPLLFSLSIARTYGRPYFSSWVSSYAWYLVTILTFLPPPTPGLTVALDLAKVVAMVLGSWYLLKTTAQIHDEPRMPMGSIVACWAVAAIAGALVVAGRPFTLVSIPPALLVVGSHFWLATRLLRLPHAGRHRASFRLAVLLVTLGLWTLSYPVVDSTGHVWLGFAISGLLHLLVGIEMVIFLLEDTAQLLRQQNEALQQLDRMKSSFISTVSHELRTPITAIKSAGFLIGSPRVPAEELKSIIAQQTDALTHIVTDMLDASLIESGTMAYQRGPVCLSSLAENAVTGMRLMFEQKGLALALEVPEQPVEVTADAGRLNQVLTNLLSNALKFTPEGRVTVRVVAEGSQARLEVVDTGIGLAPDEHTKIFERFYQVDNSNTRKVGGAGLGLAIAKAIVEEGHRGRLWVESQLGRGSTFVVSLPRTSG